MRLDTRPRFPADHKLWERKLTDMFVATNTQVNQLSEGVASAVNNAATSAPTAGTFGVGDFVKNSAPAELGAPTAKYVVYGFLCVASGTPGTWVQLRALTGN